MKPGLLMNTKSIALIICFGAIAIALNTVKIPVFFWPGNFYQVCEIPIVIAFLLFGVKIGLSVGVINLAGQLLFFLYGPVYIAAYSMAFVAISLMLIGVYFGSIFIKRKAASIKPLDAKKSIIYLTFFVVLFRGGIMPFIDFGVFHHLILKLVLGIPLSDVYIAGLFPVFVLFNATVPLYTIPIAYVVASKVGSYLKIEPRLLRKG